MYINKKHKNNSTFIHITYMLQTIHKSGQEKHESYQNINRVWWACSSGIYDISARTNRVIMSSVGQPQQYQGLVFSISNFYCSLDPIPWTRVKKINTNSERWLHWAKNQLSSYSYLQNWISTAWHLTWTTTPKQISLSSLHSGSSATDTRIRLS